MSKIGGHNLLLMPDSLHAWLVSIYHVISFPGSWSFSQPLFTLVSSHLYWKAAEPRGLWRVPLWNEVVVQAESCQLKPLCSAASSEQQLAVMLPPIVLDLPANSVRFLNITPGCVSLCRSTGPYSLHNIWPTLTCFCLSTLQNSGYLFVAQMFVWKGPREENLHQQVPRSTLLPPWGYKET